MLVKSIIVSDKVHNKVYQISQADNRNISKVMKEIIEIFLDEVI
jgi:predicted DNA-binding protein